MPDAPELQLRRTLATILHTSGLAVYTTAGQIRERGVKTDGTVPTTVAECTVLSSPPTVDDGGRVDALYRVQFFTRRTGTILTVEKWASDLRGILHRKEYTPPILGISWSYEASCVLFEPDQLGRVAVSATYAFRGRRP